jgi:carbamoyl-phosphate synthase small subunit
MYKIRGVLALADGRYFKGYLFGSNPIKPVVGEVVFNTSMYGYQEIITDPSYAGQILCFTYPHIGNVGCNEEDNESNKVHAEGVIVRDISKIASNFRSKTSLHEYLSIAGVSGIYGVDTREIVAYIRNQGAQMGAIGNIEQGSAPEKSIIDDLVDIARAKGSMEGKDYVKVVTTKNAYTWNELPWKLQGNELFGGAKKSIASKEKLSQEKLVTRPHVVAIDCGIKRNILRLLVESGFRVSVVPATMSYEEIMDLNPDCIFLSNGPGDPATLGYVVDTVKKLLGRFSLFGICLGHQILAQAVGGSTYKLKFGHRGGNHPVKDMKTEKIEITVQNHGFAVDKESLKDSVAVSHLNLNDMTVEGLDIPEVKAFSVQYHPEASPGPHDSKYLFRRFFESVVQG